MTPIRLIKIVATPINLIAISDRKFELADKAQIDYHTIGYCLGDEKALSFELINDLFRQALKLPKRFGGAGFGAVRAWLAWKGVESYFGRKAFETTDKTDRRNKGLCSFQWRARI